MSQVFLIKEYVDVSGCSPFREWLTSLDRVVNAYGE